MPNLPTGPPQISTAANAAFIASADITATTPLPSLLTIDYLSPMTPHTQLLLLPPPQATIAVPVTMLKTHNLVIGIEILHSCDILRIV